MSMFSAPILRGDGVAHDVKAALSFEDSGRVNGRREDAGMSSVVPSRVVVTNHATVLWL